MPIQGSFNWSSVRIQKMIWNGLSHIYISRYIYIYISYHIYIYIYFSTVITSSLEEGNYKSEWFLKFVYCFTQQCNFLKQYLPLLFELCIGMCIYAWACVSCPVAGRPRVFTPRDSLSFSVPTSLEICSNSV